MLTVEPRAADRRLLLVLVVGVVLVALVLGGLAAVDRVRGGASSPTALAERVVAALDREDLGALARLVEPDERTALLRLGTSLSERFADLDLPEAVGGGGPGSPTGVLDGLDLDLTGATPREESRAGEIAVVGLGDLAVRVRSNPEAARGLLRAWFAYAQVSEPKDLTYGAKNLPELGALPRLVVVQRSGRWYLSVLGTLLGPDVAQGSLARAQGLDPTWSPTPQAAVEATLRALLDPSTRTDVAALARTLDASGSDALQLWAAEVATSGLDRSPVPITSLRTAAGPVDGPVDGHRAQVRVEALRVGDGSGFDLAGRCVTSVGDRTCLHPSGYRYTGGLGSLGRLELLGRDGSFTLTAVQGREGWRTSVVESLADALTGYAAGLTREQVLMVLGQERLDAQTGVLQPDQPQDVAFTSAGYALRTVHIGHPGLYRVAPSPAGSNRASLYDADGQPSIQPFFPNDSVYRLTPGDHTLVVWADDVFARTLEKAGEAPYVQRIEVREIR